MAGGLVGLLDDVAALAKLAASSLDDIGSAAVKASSKAAGVVIDDTAVTPQYVRGLAAQRELPIVIRIAKGSIRNKLLIIVPVALLLSQFAEWLLTPILMVGGGYLCYEAVHKIAGMVTGHEEHEPGQEHLKTEDELVAGAVRTDLILSAEIMVIALAEISTESFAIRAAVLAVVALLITLLVYGVVAAIVKMDDVGLRLAQTDGVWSGFGRQMVRAMPKLLAVLSTVGTAAMLWVGGHIELVGLHEFGIDFPYMPIHDLEESIRDSVAGVGAALAWMVNTFASAVLGLFVGAPLVWANQYLRGGGRPRARQR